MLAELVQMVDVQYLAGEVMTVAQVRGGGGGQAGHVINNVVNIIVMVVGVGALYQAAKANFGNNADKKEGFTWLVIAIALFALAELILPLVGVGKGVIASLFS